MAKTPKLKTTFSKPGVDILDVHWFTQMGGSYTGIALVQFEGEEPQWYLRSFQKMAGSIEEDCFAIAEGGAKFFPDLIRKDDARHRHPSRK